MLSLWLVSSLVLTVSSGHGRYFYTQLRTGRSQWEFPTVTTAAATAATAAAPTVENGSNGVEATDVDPASSAERIVLSVEPGRCRRYLCLSQLSLQRPAECSCDSILRCVTSPSRDCVKEVVFDAV